MKRYWRWSRRPAPLTRSWNCATTDASFCFQAEDGIRDLTVTGVQTCALPISGEFTLQETGARQAGAGSLRGEFPRRVDHGRTDRGRDEIGRASCRERV